MNEVQHKLHHDARNYDVANAACAAKARDNMERAFAEGRAKLGMTLAKVQASVPTDHLVPSKKVNFLPRGDTLEMQYDEKSNIYTIHPHALSQISEKAGVDGRFTTRLLNDKQPDLLAYLLTERFHRAPPTKFLSRSVGGEVRGWLSDSYKPYDVQPLLASFLEMAVACGALPVEAECTDVKTWIKVMLPHVFEPIKDEPMAYGLIFGNSDFGAGAVTLRSIVRRPWCTNDAIAEETMRQVHLGAKLQDSTFSAETKRLEADTLASAMKDIIIDALSPESVNVKMTTIRLAAEKQVPIKETLETMRKNGDLLKSEVERAMELWTTADVELLPPVTGKPEPGMGTAYRFSNLLSLLAQEQDPARGLELQHAAGEYMGFAKKAAKA